jgi:hypothetical protein
MAGPQHGYAHLLFLKLRDGFIAAHHIAAERTGGIG